MMQVTLDASGAMAPASATDPITRNAYTPYGAVRGADNLTIDHGWLNQVSDEASTGLVYLNARYYDPLASRFISPDPLVNPTDPQTLDAFRYSDNNPANYADPTGMIVYCGKGKTMCVAKDDNDASTINVTTKPAGTSNAAGGQSNAGGRSNAGGPGPESPPLSTELEDFTSGDDVTCPPWVPCGSYTSWTGTVTWDPKDSLTYQDFLDSMNTRGTPMDLAKWWKDHGDELGLALAIAGMAVCTFFTVGACAVAVGLGLSVTIADGMDNRGMTAKEALILTGLTAVTFGVGGGARGLTYLEGSSPAAIEKARPSTYSL